MRASAFDTSALVPALLEWHEHHAPARAHMDRALAEKGAAIVPLTALLETFAVLTRLPAPWRLSTRDAHQLLTQTLRGGARMAALEGDDAWTLLDGAMSLGIAGSAIHDAHIAACAREAGAEDLVTWNRRDFERLDLGDLALVTPR